MSGATMMLRRSFSCQILGKILLKSYKCLAFNLLFVGYSVNSLKNAQRLPALGAIPLGYRMLFHSGSG